MGWIGKTTAIVAIVAAAGLTAGAAVQSTAKDKAKEKAATDKGRQVRIIERVGPGQRVMALGGGPRLGVSLQEASGEKAQAAGAVVAEVEQDSPAAKAGLESGDIIVEFDGERVRGVRQLQRLVNETPAGRAIKVGVSRDGKRVDLSATLEEADWPGMIGFDKQKLEEKIQRGVDEGMRGMREFRWQTRIHRSRRKSRSASAAKAGWACSRSSPSAGTSGSIRGGRCSSGPRGPGASASPCRSWATSCATTSAPPAACWCRA